MSEPLHEEAYRGPFGEADLFYYPTAGRDGTLQLAERYSQDGQDIIWDNHDATRSSDPEALADRQAIIIDSANNRYYLAGDTLYDITESEAHRRPEGERFEDYPMPDLKIGEAAVFSKGHTVKSVLIATDTAKFGDRTLLGAEEGRNNPFLSAFARLKDIAHMPEAAGPEEAPIRATRLGVHAIDPALNDPFFPKDGIIGYDYARVRAPHKPGKMMPAGDLVKIEHGEMEYPEHVRSRYGMRISPNVSGPEYEPRGTENVRLALGELSMRGKDILWRAPGLRQLAERHDRKIRDAAEAHWTEVAENGKPVPEEFRYLERDHWRHEYESDKVGRDINKIPPRYRYLLDPSYDHWSFH